MAITPIKPKTLQEVLAEQTKVVTPSATPVTTSPTKATNQAILEANKAKAAEREANKQAILNPPELDGGGFGSGVTQQERDYMSMGTAGSQYGVSSQQDYNTKYGNMYDASGRLKQTSTTPTIKPPTVPKIDSPTINAKTQVGRLVSDFKSTLTSTGGDKDAFYSGINYEGLSDKEKNVADRFVEANKTKFKEKDLYDTYADTLKQATEKTKTQYEVDQEAQIAAEKLAKDDLDRLTSESTAEIDSAFNTFQTEQNDLLKNYESNRLNQVQGDLRRALLSRGVDISKIPPEQLIALSGSVGAQAFSDISGAKERATTAIETARQNRLAKVQQLKANKVLNDAQFNKQVASINSVANQAKNNLDMKFAETVFGIKTAQDTKKETTETNKAQAIMNTAQSLGVSGSQFGVVSKFIQDSKTTPEALQAMFAELSNPSSALYTIIKSNEDAASKQQAFKNQIDLLEAQAKLKSASRTGGSGTTTVNPDYKGA